MLRMSHGRKQFAMHCMAARPQSTKQRLADPTNAHDSTISERQGRRKNGTAEEWPRNVHGHEAQQTSTYKNNASSHPCRGYSTLFANRGLDGPGRQCGCNEHKTDFVVDSMSRARSTCKNRGLAPHHRRARQERGEGGEGRK